MRASFLSFAFAGTRAPSLSIATLRETAGENVGEGNPDYFHAIRQAELEAQLASRSLQGPMLRAYQEELLWRARFKGRARSARQIFGLSSYDYQLNPEYQRL